jgi:hypothetical protein
MNSKRKTGYGVVDISRQIARRVQKDWEMVENPPVVAALMGSIINFPTPQDPRPPTSQRALAA